MLDFTINSPDSLSKLIKEKEIVSWQELVTYVKNIPYGRNSNRTDSRLVLTENKGTCSSKHALLKRIADIHGAKNIELFTGIYKMNSTNTPKIGNILLENGLDYIPEAHCYLRYKGETIDATSDTSDFERIKKDIIIERKIQPDQVANFKEQFHQNFIKTWIISERLNFSYSELWEIREECIYNLST
ncbi:hypothetical protein [Aquimarina rubra]|uniref:Transglutaminase-like domain-containing protein n=1 Tax=Aquimarina rubra TaxID=1920033 RepID=A0ABW5LAH5_9FLAO